MEKIIQLPTQSRAASFQPATVDAERRTVECVWSTGAPVMRYDWFSGTRYIEVLSLEKSAVRMDRLKNGAPLLNTHNAFELEAVLGVCEKAWIADGEARAVVRFADTPEITPIWEKVRQGVIRNISVGYLVHKIEKTKTDDSKIETWRALDWEPVELSAVPVGADAGAGFRSGSPAMNDCEVVSVEHIDEPAFDFQAVRFVGADGKELSPDQIQAFMRRQAANQTAAGQVVPPDYRALRARLEMLKVA